VLGGVGVGAGVGVGRVWGVIETVGIIIIVTVPMPMPLPVIHRYGITTIAPGRVPYMEGTTTKPLAPTTINNDARNNDRTNNPLRRP